MSDASKIEWTDTTWNPVTGCTKVSAGCAHCYAETLFPRVYGRERVEEPSSNALGEPTIHNRPRRFTDVKLHHDRLDQPLRWRKPRRVFVNSMSDLFHETVPDSFIARVFEVMGCPNGRKHTFQILTKRPDRMREFMRKWKACELDDTMLEPDRSLAGGELLCPLPNVWLGVSVEDQATADERIPILLDTPAAVRFLSCEPLLGPVRCDQIGIEHDDGDVILFPLAGEYTCEGLNEPVPLSMHPDRLGKIDWVIAGGESGPKARPCDVAWIRWIVEQCRAASVPVFVKQLGAFSCTDLDGSVRLSGLKSRKGSDPSEWTADLRVREFPEANDG